MNIEMERRFLLFYPDNLTDFLHGNIFKDIDIEGSNFLTMSTIKQCYFKNNINDFLSQRVRVENILPKNGNSRFKYTMNIKSKINDLKRYEFEYEIPKADALFMINNFCDKCIYKLRYKFDINDLIWEINILENLRLIVAEVELTEEQNKNLVIPFQYEKEVTEDASYLAENLAEQLQ